MHSGNWAQTDQEEPRCQETFSGEQHDVWVKLYHHKTQESMHNQRRLHDLLLPPTTLTWVTELDSELDKTKVAVTTTFQFTRIFLRLVHYTP